MVFTLQTQRLAREGPHTPGGGLAWLCSLKSLQSKPDCLLPCNKNRLACELYFDWLFSSAPGWALRLPCPLVVEQHGIVIDLLLSRGAKWSNASWPCSAPHLCRTLFRAWRIPRPASLPCRSKVWGVPAAFEAAAHQPTVSLLHHRCPEEIRGDSQWNL